MDLSRFEDLGMTIVSKGHSGSEGEKGQVTLKYNNDTKSVYISMDMAIAEIAFSKSDDLVVLPILDHKRDRVYMVENEDGYRFTLSHTTRNGKRLSGNRLSMYSKPLFEQMTKHGYRSLKSKDLLFDNKLNAYYFEVK